MSATERGRAGVNVDMKLEIQIVPVSDVDRSKAFYEQAGWRLDDDVAPMDGLRIVQFTPPGSGASITSASLAGYPVATLFVAYCSGPHCNGAQRAALRLARLGRPVKIMIGGMSGWREEGFALEYGTASVVRSG